MRRALHGCEVGRAVPSRAGRPSMLSGVLLGAQYSSSAVGAADARPTRRGSGLLHVGHGGHGVAARVASRSRSHDDHGRGARQLGEAARPGRRTVVAGDSASPRAVEPHELRRPSNAQNMQRDAAVLAEVGDRLGPAAGEVEVGDPVGAEHAERVVALGRQVDVAVAPSSGAVATKNTCCALDPARSGVVQRVEASCPCPPVCRRAFSAPRSPPGRGAAAGLAGVVAGPGQGLASTWPMPMPRRRPRPGRRTPRAATSGRRGGGGGRPQVLADRDDLDADARQVGQGLATTSSSVSPMPDDDARLGGEAGRLGPGQHGQRAGVGRGGAHGPLEPGDRLDVVVQHVGPRGEDRTERARVALAIGDEHLDLRPGCRCRTAAMVAANASAPPSARSSRATAVTTA